MEEALKMSPTPTRHHRIHIAGLSPYQRRVARIGNGLEISDDEWDKPEPAISPTRSYHFRPEERDSERRSGLSLNLENSMKSLPVNINQEFTMKKASPPVQVPAPLTPIAGENLRRSYEILKFSNEGLINFIYRMVALDNVSRPEAFRIRRVASTSRMRTTRPTPTAP
jgi:hypothetical protein